MRILFITSYYPPSTLGGGYMQLCEEVADGLAARGHEIAVLTSTRCDGPQKAHPYPVHRQLSIDPDWHSGQSAARQFFVGRRQREQAALAQFSRLIGSFRPDAVSIWNGVGLPRTLFQGAEKALPTAYYFADYLPELPDEYIAYWRSAPVSLSARLLKRPAAAVALAMLHREGKPVQLGYQHVMCVSEYVRQRLVQQGLIPAHSVVVHNGVDLSVFVPARRAARRQSETSLRCLVAGRVVPDKGVHTVIAALGLLGARAASFRLTILGDGPQQYVAQLREAVQQGGLDAIVKFQPGVPRDQMPRILAQHDLLLLPSEYAEPIARSMQEAMALGLLVVGTTTGGSGELLVHEQTGLVFETGNPQSLTDQLERALADPCAADALAATGQARVRESFRIEQTVDKVEAYLQSIITPAQSEPFMTVRL